MVIKSEVVMAKLITSVIENKIAINGLKQQLVERRKCESASDRKEK